jgi:hypothetical protein
MLVTNRDCIIADYAIRSYSKLYNKRSDYGNKNFVLFIYLNCLSQENKKRYVKKWTSYRYTKIFDNSIKVENFKKMFSPGEKIISPEGIATIREDFTEHCDEVWDSELKKFDTPFIATVDADFEILNPDFYIYLINQLEKQPNLIGASTCFNPTEFVYDTYTKREAILNERNHTWFCIYKREAFHLSTTSQFFYEAVTENKQLSIFDSAAYFQYDLKTNYKKEFLTLPKEYRHSFVHYEAASKNKSLNRFNFIFYRFVFICINVGFLRGKTSNNYFIRCNEFFRRLSRKVFGNYVQKLRKERSTFVFDN